MTVYAACNFMQHGIFDEAIAIARVHHKWRHVVGTAVVWQHCAGSSRVQSDVNLLLNYYYIILLLNLLLKLGICFARKVVACAHQ